jgi:hypothetical protein
MILEEGELNMFRPGDTVTLEIDHFNPDFWNGLSESDRIKYYSVFGYGSKPCKLFTFITYHYPQLDHCVLMDIDDGKLFPMCHASNFRLVSDDEC